MPRVPRVLALPVALLCATFLVVRAAAPPAEINLLAFGDWGWMNSSPERSLARRMATYARENRIAFDAALVLGDNFYGRLPGGVQDPRWRTEFEEMYDRDILDMPFYAALGNHDYDRGKDETLLAYPRRHPDSRWKMPARWYRVEIPAAAPIVSVLVLDSNKPQLKGAWSDELAWLKQELGKPRPGRWVIAMAHHPLFSNGEHGDTPWLLRDWGPLFRSHKVDFYLCGHDHELQHLEMDGWPTSFVIAGGGGADLGVLKRHDRGPFAEATFGFVHLRLTRQEARVKLVSGEGKVLHEFTR